MKNRTLILYVTMIVLALSGCRTIPTSINQATNVPKDRIFAKMQVLSQSPSSLTLIRDTGLLGAEHVFEFWVNGLLVAELNSGDKFTTPVEPGTVIIEVRMFNVLGKLAPAQVETVLASGRIYVYRAGIDDTPRLHLARDLDLSK
ncbi:MAG: hypothetical protein WCS87_18730 [Methylococcaceae bacterium]